MRTASPAILLIVGPIMFSTQWASAEVFKCTTPEGKTSYSQSPCTSAGASEVVVPIEAAPPGAPAKGKDWAAENAAIDARLRAAAAAAAATAAAASGPVQKASAPTKSAQQIVAECEANRGVDCSSAEEIAKRQADDRALTPDEAAELQRASAGRRELERAAAEAKAREKAKDGAKSPAASPGVNGPAKPGK